MNFDIKKYNVLEIDDYIIGQVQDILITFKDRMKYIINEINDENSDISKNEVETSIEFVNALYQDVITDKIYFNSLIKVYYSGMGEYRYHILEEMENY